MEGFEAIEQAADIAATEVLISDAADEVCPDLDAYLAAEVDAMYTGSYLESRLIDTGRALAA